MSSESPQERIRRWLDRGAPADLRAWERTPYHLGRAEWALETLVYGTAAERRAMCELIRSAAGCAGVDDTADPPAELEPYKPSSMPGRARLP